MSRPLFAVLVTCAALVVSAALAAAAVAIGVPTVSVPTVAAPTATLPTATVPSVTVGSLSTPQVTTPKVTTPSLTTPSVSTPSTTTVPVQLPPVKTPSLGVRSGTSPSTTPASSSTASRGATSQAGAPSASAAAGSAASAPSSSGRARSTVGRAGGSRRSSAGSASGTARRSSRDGTATSAGTVAAAVGSGSRDQKDVLAHRSPTARAADRQSSGSGSFSKLVTVLPTAFLVALLAFAVIAAAMALNAYLQSRRAKSLAGQRAALVSDVGVLQAALLPAVPESLGELDVSVAYRPAQGLAAGGDFFDVFTVGPGRTGIIIGDVSGHGRESLIHAALVRYTLRTLMGEGHPLPEVLARADRYLTGELGDGFATVVICCYEHATGELTWAKAGHEPPLIADQPDHEEQAATPLGFGMGDSWPQFSRALAPGDRVCLFTDGLVEARRRGEHLGRAHLKALVDQGLSAQALVEQIQADSDDCPDDLAAVVISRAAVVAPLESPAAPRAAVVAPLESPDGPQAAAVS